MSQDISMNGFTFTQLNAYSFTLAKGEFVINVRVIQESEFGAYNRSEVWIGNQVLESFNTVHEALEYVLDRERMSILKGELLKLEIEE